MTENIVAKPTDESFERFLVPEQAVSLKLIFDNVRNWTIIGALVAAQNWLRTHGLGPWLEKPVFVLWCLLTILNAMQTIVLPFRYFVSRWRDLRFLQRLAVVTVDVILVAYTIVALAAGVGIAVAVLGHG